MLRWILPACYFIFALLSVQILFSVAPQLADRQLTSFILGAVLFFFVSRIPFSHWLNLRWPLYFAAIILLIIPLVFFDPTRGTHRWIDIAGVFTIQSSQLTLPLTAFVLIYLLTTAKEYSWQVLLHYLVLLGVPAILILIEPDLGSTIGYALPLLGLILVVPFSFKKIGALIAVGVIGSIFAWNFVLHPYQKARIYTFIDPASTDNYNAHQALITVGSGKFFGRGLGQGVQSHLRFLPERQTDFIFASFAEEYGFIGCMVILGLYAVMWIGLFQASQKTTHPAEQLFLLSLLGTLVLQASINIHMNLGLLPITGITLPLMSYGGSSILGIAIALGVAQNICQNLTVKPALHIS